MRREEVIMIQWSHTLFFCYAKTEKRLLNYNQSVKRKWIRQLKFKWTRINSSFGTSNWTPGIETGHEFDSLPQSSDFPFLCVIPLLACANKTSTVQPCHLIYWMYLRHEFSWGTAHLMLKTINLFTHLYTIC